MRNAKEKPQRHFRPSRSSDSIFPDVMMIHVEWKKSICLLQFRLFICGAANWSGRGKRCSSSSCCCCWGTIFQSPMYSFLGCEKAKTLSKKRCDKAKTLSKKGCYKAETLSQNGCEKAKTLSKILFSTPQISESIPFLFSCDVIAPCHASSHVWFRFWEGKSPMRTRSGNSTSKSKSSLLKIIGLTLLVFVW